MPISLHLSHEIPREEEVRYFFSSYPYLSLRPHARPWCFRFWNEHEDLDHILFFEQENSLSLPYMAPYGGIELNPRLQVETLSSLFISMRECVAEYTISEIRMRLPAAGIEPSVSLWRNALLIAEFALDYEDTNYHLDLGLDYVTNLEADAARRYRNSSKAGFKFEKCDNPDVDFLYGFISRNRKEKNYPLNISPEDLKLLLAKASDRYPVFVVRDGDTIIATMVCVRVNSDLLYCFLPADHPEYRRYSPTIYLIGELRDWCLAEEITLFDYGIATEEGTANEGLSRFKRNIGCAASAKPTLSYKFR